MRGLQVAAYSPVLQCPFLDFLKEQQEPYFYYMIKLLLKTAFIQLAILQCGMGGFTLVPEINCWAPEQLCYLGLLLVGRVCVSVLGVSHCPTAGPR